MTLIWIVGCLAFVGAAHGCGVPANAPILPGHTRIVNGEEAVPHSWPWQVSLQKPDGRHFCGGSLINANWVVTAAHCNVGAEDRVILGEHNKVCGCNIQVSTPAEVVTHPHWFAPSMSNDIALIKLSRPARLDANVSPVCLAEPADVFAAGTGCVITGWGLRNYQASAAPERLRQAALPLVSEEECKAHWGYLYSKSMLCAGGRGANVCTGDFGGPLVCQKNQAWTLVGIASWGCGTCSDNIPGVYTRIAALRNWIDTVVAAS